MPAIQPPEVRPADKITLPGIRLAVPLGVLARAALLGVVSATVGLGVAGWITGLVTGSAAAALALDGVDGRLSRSVPQYLQYQDPGR